MNIKTNTTPISILSILSILSKNSPKPIISAPPATLRDTSPSQKPEDLYQVVLHNDDSIAAEHVVQCLTRILKHDTTMAFKIMFDAHKRGKSIAEVEGEALAKLHSQQLQSARLTVTMNKI